MGVIITKRNEIDGQRICKNRLIVMGFKRLIPTKLINTNLYEILEKYTQVYFEASFLFKSYA